MKKFLMLVVLFVATYLIYEINSIRGSNIEKMNFFEDIQIPKLDISISCSSFAENFLNQFLGSKHLKNKLSLTGDFSMSDNERVNHFSKISQERVHTLKLLGVVFWKGKSYAVLLCDSHFFFVEEGDKICQNVEIDRINDSSILVKIGNKEKILQVFNSNEVLE